MGNHLASSRVVSYNGGFMPIGGVETFTRDLLAGLASHASSRQLICWGQRSALLDSVAATGCQILRSPLKSGCRWAIPDRVLWPLARSAVLRADVLLFPKLFHEGIHRKIRRLTQSSGRPVPSIFITPYRPREMFPDRSAYGILECFDLVAVQAPAFADDLKDAGYSGPVAVVPYIPPPPSASPPPLAAGEVIKLGYLGRFEGNKNLPYLLAGFAEVLKIAEQPWELHLFGAGSQEGWLREQLARPEFEKRLFLHGARYGGEVAAAIDECDLFAISSITEGQCLVALEVLSRGRPLVATPVGALPEILRDPLFGELVPQAEPAAFARALVSVVSQSRAGERSARAIVERYAKRYDQREVIAQYVGILDQACQRKKQVH